ncbi:hypothetical protein FACS1894177_01770 [Bacteroidia bacterium]|nr:hypothetical protein FACS1894177_01770 [Bacteroidia bacterium]
MKVEKLLGIYLEDRPEKLSYNGLQTLENNVIHLRYGGYENLKWGVLCLPFGFFVYLIIFLNKRK